MRDFTPEAFAAFLGEAALAVEHRSRSALEEAARIVEHEAKTEIGHYQEQAGPFVPWAELADATKDDRVRQGFTENDPGLRSGTMRDSINHRVEGSEAHIGSDDQNLVYFELGTDKQPPRTVLAGALIRKTDEVVETLGRRFVASLTGDGVANEALPLDGER